MTHQLSPEVRLLLTLCRLPAGSIDADCSRIQDWDFFLRLAAHHRLTPLLARNAAGLSLPPEIAAALQSRTQANAVEAFRWLAETQRLLDLLAASSINATVLKGVPLSLQAYGDAATRDAGDIDLLIRPDEAEEADRLLLAHDFVRKDPAAMLTPRRRASYTRHFKDYTYEPLTMQSQGGFEVDLHWRLFRNPAMPGNRPLAKQRTEIAAGGMGLTTLSPQGHLLYLAVQGAIDGWTRLKAVADVAALWDQIADPEAALAGAREAGVTPYLHAALLLARSWLGRIDLPEKFAQPSALTRHIVARAERGMEGFLPELRESSSWAMKRYEASLHPSFGYKAAIVQRVLYRPRVWTRFDLPDALFPLYPLLSPLEWLLFRLDRGRVRRRSLREWLLLAEAGLWLLAARAALRVLPVTRIVRWVRQPLASRKASDGTVERCRWAVTAFSRNAPLRLVCFPQALALHAMLRRRGIVSEVLYGAARLEDGQLAAHAWLRRDGVVLVGGETAGRFSVLDTWTPADS